MIPKSQRFTKQGSIPMTFWHMVEHHQPPMGTNIQWLTQGGGAYAETHRSNTWTHYQLSEKTGKKMIIAAVQNNRYIEVILYLPKMYPIPYCTEL